MVDLEGDLAVILVMSEKQQAADVPVMSDRTTLRSLTAISTYSSKRRPSTPPKSTMSGASRLRGTRVSTDPFCEDKRAAQANCGEGAVSAYRGRYSGFGVERYCLSCALRDNRAFILFFLSNFMGEWGPSCMAAHVFMAAVAGGNRLLTECTHKT